MGIKQIEGADFSIRNAIHEDYVGKLLVIEPLSFEKDVKTTHGLADAIAANVYVVKSADGSKFEAFEDSLIFARALVRVLKGKVGKVVVGRLAQGQAKPSQDPPWLLSEPDAKDLAAAKALVFNLNSASAEPEDDGLDSAPVADEEPAF
jgi:hypothetical protein